VPLELSLPLEEVDNVVDDAVEERLCSESGFSWVGPTIVGSEEK
jgi:hypothetical protein